MRLALAAFLALLVAAPTTAAAEQDIRGTWNCCTQSTNPLVGTQFEIITTEDLSTGQWSGWGYGGSYTWPISGQITGNQVTFKIPYYNELRTYSAQGTGTITGNTWQSHFTDSNGNSGDTTAVKSSGPPPPVAGKSVDAQRVSGTVLVKLPGDKAFGDLGKVAVPLPVGTIVDVRQGRITLTATGGTGTFYGGEFRIGQRAAPNAVTNLTLVGGDFTVCGKTAALAAATRGKKVRNLWADAKGLFRTTGRYASATVRGTKWNTADYCNGTLITVAKGAVTVRDIPRKKNVVVTAGGSYFARAKR